jgi:hypothetical protein
VASGLIKDGLHRTSYENWLITDRCPTQIVSQRKRILFIYCRVITPYIQIAVFLVERYTEVNFGWFLHIYSGIAIAI